MPSSTVHHGLNAVLADGTTVLMPDTPKNQAVFPQQSHQNFWAYNIIRGNLAQAAIMHNKIPRQLSFRSAVQLVCQAAKQLVALTGKQLAHALLALVKAMASTSIGLQKRKHQPRAIKRRPKPFLLLTVPRHEDRLTL